jgi:hypothetical protein
MRLLGDNFELEAWLAATVNEATQPTGLLKPVCLTLFHALSPLRYWRGETTVGLILLNTESNRPQ